MSSTLDIPLDELVRANKQKQTPRQQAEGNGGHVGLLHRPGGGCRPQAESYGGVGLIRRTGGGYNGDSFYGANAFGAIRRTAFQPSLRPSPYMPLQRDSDGPWKHDLFDEVGTNFYTRSLGAIETITKVIISNLDYGVSDADIKALFSDVGDVKQSEVHYDRSGRSMGKAVVLYSRKADAEKAVERYHGVLLDGKPMNVRIIGANLPVASAPVGVSYRRASVGRPEARPLGWVQDDVQLPQLTWIPRIGTSIERIERSGTLHDREQLEKMKCDLDADLDKYHAAAKKKGST